MIEKTYKEHLEDMLSDKECSGEMTGYQHQAVDAMIELLSVCSYEELCNFVKAKLERKLVILSEPMRPMIYKPKDTDVYCPKCGNTLSGAWELSDADDYRKLCQCPKCGQSIDDTKCILDRERGDFNGKTL